MRGERGRPTHNEITMGHLGGFAAGHRERDREAGTDDEEALERHSDILSFIYSSIKLIALI